MPSFNRVLIMGNLTRDPELRHTPNNTPVCNIGLAVNRKWKNQQGQQQEETTFVDCTAFGRVAEVVNQYTHKGAPLFVEGRLKLDQWQDRDGKNRSKLEVVVEQVQLLEGRTGQTQSSRANTPPASSPAQTGNHTAVEDDLIPF